MSKGKVGTKALSVFMSVVLVVGLMPLPAYAGDAPSGGRALAPGGIVQAQAGVVSYVELGWDGSKVVANETSHEASPVPGDGKMTSGWYVLDRDVEVDGRVCLTGDTDLILGDGKTLDVKGLHVPKGSTLRIYGQAGGTGRLYSHPSKGAGVGAYSEHKGGAVEVHGGTVEAEGAKNCAGIGGNDGDLKDIGGFTMYGGTVEVTGGASGAGIGGGRACEGGAVTIYGGTVTATGGHYGAGIGGGNGQDTDPMRGAHGGTIKIYGGTVTATGGDDAAGIGGGEGGNAGAIEIGGTPETTAVTAQGGDYGAGIGCGEGESTGVGGTVTISGGKVTATGGKNAAGIGGGEDGHCNTITISGTDATTDVTATGGANGAGIGAGRDADGGTIRITGGKVTATGTDSSAGIGGGDASGSYADYSDIAISGGKVTATGNSKGAGIGGGEYGHATIEITGGEVAAKGNGTGPGIGDGEDGSGSSITLGWTKETKDIKITASSFKGNVALAQPFTNGESFFRETSSVEEENLATLAANPPLEAWIDAEPIATTVSVNSWRSLQDAINNAKDELTAELSSSIDARGASAITIPSGKDIVIDLNGKEMNRGLASASAAANGGAVVVEKGAALTVKDSSGGGVITGGNTTGNGGGILNRGTLNLEGGSISGNTAQSGGGISNEGVLTVSGGTISDNAASGWGGGVYLSNVAGNTLNLKGGTIQGNVCDSDNNASGNGGGVHVSENARMEISGGPVVTGNAKGPGGGAPANNVSLADGTFIIVADKLTSEAQIGVRMSQPAASNITSGLRGRGTAANFSSDDSAYELRIDGGGEAFLYKAADSTASNWEELQNAVNNASSNGNDVIELTEELTCPSNKTRILVSGNKSVTIDLAGHALDRNLSSKKDNGHVIEVLGGSTLTIRDSKGGGKVCGGYSSDGGGIYVNKNATCNISGGSVTDNESDDDGAGIYVRGTLKMTGGSVLSNRSNDCGGGIYVTDEGTIDLTGADISYNKSDDDGAGLKVFMKSDSRIAHCTISSNESDDHGGGLYVDAKGKTLTITDTDIDNNESDDDGAGLYLENGTINMSGGSLSENTTDNDGGGAKITKGTAFNAIDVTISGNTAKSEEGGGVKNYGTTTLSGCTISNNSSNKQGGGVFNDDTDGSEGVLTLEDCKITGNRSTDDNGGGVYSDYKLTLSGGKITGNSAGNRGGGVFIGDDSKDTNISGKLIVKDNRAKLGGKEIYLRTHKLVLIGALEEGSSIGITKENDDGLGVFTGSYSLYNGRTNPDPADFFFSPEGLEVISSGGEASLASSGWNELRALLINVTPESPFEYELDRNYAASSDDDCLEIPANTKVTIDLKGHTLNRNRSSKDGDGHVIWVRKGATLILKDSTATGDEAGDDGTTTGDEAGEDSTATGAKPGKGTITGGYSKRGGGIYVDENATCEIDGINVKENRASDDGGGIYVKGYLKATNSIVSDNVADDAGGGIFSEDTGHIDLDHVTVTGNDCEDDGAGMKLWMGADSTIKNSEIRNNSTEDHGGGMYVDAKGKTLTIENTKIEDNKSAHDGAGIFLYRGAIVMTGGTLSKNKSDNDSGGIKVTSKTTFTATNVTISGNKAEGEEGGGVKNYGTTTLTGCTISGNSAGKHGGGVFNDNDGGSAGTLTVDGCTFTGNKAEDDGGAIYSDKKLVLKGSAEKPTTIGGSDANKNEASGGGGIKIGKDSDKTEISGKIVITKNSADRGPDLYLRDGQKLKLTGKIDGTSIGVIDMDSPDVFTDGFGSRYPAANEDGSAISENAPDKFFSTDPAAIPAEWNKEKTEATLHSYWGELQAKIDAAAKAEKDKDHVVELDMDYRAGSSDVQLKVRKIEGSTVENNGKVTIDLKGHILNRNRWSKKANGHVIEVYEGSVLTIKDSEASLDNPDENTGIITGGNANYGGGIYINEGATLNFESGTVAGNRANDNGGGILNYGTLKMTGGYVLMNSAEDNGGGIYSSDSSSLSLKNVTISGNMAGDNGGGINIRLKDDAAVIENCAITENTAGDYGGGVRLDADEKTLTIKNTEIEGNSSFDDGAGIYLRYGTINMTGGTVKRNGSVNDAGGIKVTSKTFFTADGVTISDNRATREEGGGVKNYGTMTLTNCTIENNTAAEQGGGIFNDNDGKSAGDLTLKNCTIRGNVSQDDGGGVYSDKKLKIIGGTIDKGNTGKRGGGVYIGADSEATKVEGDVVIKDNTATKTGNNLFLQDDRMLSVTGPLSAVKGEKGKEQTVNAEIWLDLDEGAGKFAKDYPKYNKAKNENNEEVTVDPKTFFKPAKGYGIVVNKDDVLELTSNWKALKAKIESYEGNDPFKLDDDYAAKNSDDRIEIDGNKNITIDLNGFTLNRNRGSETDDGHVFEVFGGSTLTIIDSGGKTANDGDANDGNAAGSGANDGDTTGGDAGGTANDGGTVDGAAKIGTIMGGWSERGGGIYVNKNATLNLQGGRITGNRADTNGGGVFVKSGGTFTMTGGSVESNKTDGSGGGIYLEEDAVLNLEGGKISGNDAGKQGGGLIANSGAKVNVKGSPVVSGNHTTKKGHDIYLPSRNLLTVTGAFAEGAELGIALENSWGQFTSNYETFNEERPARYFMSTEGHEVYKNKAGEAELHLSSFGKTDDADSFVSWKNQIDTNSAGLSSFNWMAGVSGERYLTDINIPGSHDSSMNKVQNINTSQGITEIIAGVSLLVLGGFLAFSGVGLGALIAGGVLLVSLGISAAMPNDLTSFGAWVLQDATAPRAKTQKEYIYQQLDEGCRQLDLRVYHRYKTEKWYGWVWEDDGTNLYVCHGKDPAGGRYLAQDEDGNPLTLDQILVWVKDFLVKHPTETIVLDLRTETKYSDEEKIAYQRMRTILENSTLDINPSTGEPFLYKESGSDDFFAPYTRIPKLADCRGKIVLTPDNASYTRIVGGFKRGTLISEFVDRLDFKDTASMMIDQATDEYAKVNPNGSQKLPTDGETYNDRLWYWELNCTGQNGQYVLEPDPHVIAETVNPGMIGDTKTFGKSRTGQYIGWVRLDSFRADYAEQIWRTNFFDGLEYRTVTVKSSPDDTNPQTYKVLKGTKLTVPGNIYKQTGTYFAGWLAADGAASGKGDPEGSGTIYNEGDSFKVNDNVTFTAQWLEVGQVPVRVVWKDGDDADGLRPESVKLKAEVAGESTDMTLSREDGWSKPIRVVGDSPVTITPDWGLIGQDVEGQYAYRVDFVEGTGYVVTLTHTPNERVTFSGKVFWEDDDNAAGLRPNGVTVHLFKQGAEVASQTVTADGGWTYGFDMPLYENGEKLSYVVIEDTVEHYQSSREGDDITYTYVEDPSLVSVSGMVEWDDASDAKGLRPEKALIYLVAGGEEISHVEAASSGASRWEFGFDDMPLNNGEEAIDYSVIPAPVPGYSVTCERIAVLDKDNSSDAGGESAGKYEVFYRITYTLDVQEDEKEPATVDEAPEAKDLDYTGEPQELVGKGFVSGGKMLYAMGAADGTAPDADAYGEELPEATDSGAYRVWYYAKGDAAHSDSKPAYVESTIAGVGFRTHSILLDGQIGVKFYMDLSGLTPEERAKGKVTFKVAGRGGFESVDRFDENDMNPSGRLYGFTCYVNAIQMADRITATFSCEAPDKVTDELTDEYSVADYVRWTEGNAEAYAKAGDAGEATLALVRALADYGHYVQPFLSATRGWKIGEDYAEAPAASELAESDVAAAEAAAAAHAVKWTVPAGSGVAKPTFALKLNTGTDIYLYFRMEGGARVASASIDGKPAEPALCPDGRYLVVVPNVQAHELGVTHEVAAKTSTGAEVTAKVSAVSYAHGLFASDAYGDDAVARKAVTALYRYWDAAVKYLEATGEGA